MPWFPEDLQRAWVLAATCAAAWATAGCTGWPQGEAGIGAAPAPVVSAAVPVTAASAAAAAAASAAAAATAGAAARALGPDPQTLADAATRRLLAFHERVRELPPAEVSREQARLDAARQPADGDANEAAAATLELALLLAQTRAGGDLARALSLAEPLARGAGPPRWQPIARLITARLADQRRSEEQTEKQAQQLRDQQRRIEQLNNQLEALKAIERSLNTRPAPPPPAVVPGSPPAPGNGAPAAPAATPAAPRSSP